MALYFPDLTVKEIQKYFWITNSGSLTYMYTQDIVFTNYQTNKSGVEVREESTSAAPKIGKWYRNVIGGKTGETLNVCLKKTLLVPGLMNSLFYLTQAMASTCRFCNHKKGYIWNYQTERVCLISIDKSRPRTNLF